MDLKHAYENVPMYRRKFDAAGVILMISGNFQTCVNFPVPPNRSARQLSFRHLCRADGTSGAIHASSGTTGKPTVVGYTQNELITGPIL